jgi:cysteinyl-tRNA synthetase
MVTMIGQLVEIGRGYTTEDGVYLSVESVEDYGLLVNQDLPTWSKGAVTARSSAPRTSGTPPTSCCGSWPSPASRRGRHLGATAGPAGTASASVMSLDILGEGLRSPLRWDGPEVPHHENERRSSRGLGQAIRESLDAQRFVVDAEGEKMSKSLGNVSNLLDLVEHYDPRAIACCPAAVPLPRAGVGRPGQHRRIGQRVGRPRFVCVAHRQASRLPTPTPR